MKKQTEPIPCANCGELHSRGAWAAADVIMNSKRRVQTKFGQKSRCGIAALIDDQTYAPELLAFAESVRVWLMFPDTSKKTLAKFESEVNTLVAKAKGEA